MMSKKNKETLYQYVKDNYWSTFRRNTMIVSSTCRQLALGIGSILWLFISKDSYLHVTCLSKFILIILVIFFILDISQYLYKSYRFKKIALKFEKQIEKNIIRIKSEICDEPEMHKITDILFVLKLIALGLASIFIVILFLKI